MLNTEFKDELLIFKGLDWQYSQDELGNNINKAKFFNTEFVVRSDKKGGEVLLYRDGKFEAIRMNYPDLREIATDIALKELMQFFNKVDVKITITENR